VRRNLIADRQREGQREQQRERVHAERQPERLCDVASAIHPACPPAGPIKPASQWGSEGSPLPRLWQPAQSPIAVTR